MLCRKPTTGYSSRLISGLRSLYIPKSDLSPLFAILALFLMSFNYEDGPVEEVINAAASEFSFLLISVI